MNRFDNTTILITGAAGGMGSSHAHGFHSEGGNVVIADVRDDAGKALAAELGERTLFIHHDATSETDWTATVAQSEALFGPISVLVNNARIRAR